MRASQVVAVALVAGALLTAIGAHAWLQSTDTESAVHADVRAKADTREPVPPMAPRTSEATAAAADVSAASQTPAPTAPIPTDSAGSTAAQPAASTATSLEARMAEAGAESAHHTERYLHSRRDDGQHAE